MLLPGLVAIALMPLVILWLYPPEIRDTEDAHTFALSRLAELGPVKTSEKILLGVFAWLLFLWAGIPEMIAGKAYAVDATTAAFSGLTLLLLAGVLSWEEVLAEKSAWDTITWFAALVMNMKDHDEVSFQAAAQRLIGDTRRADQRPDQPRPAHP